MQSTIDILKAIRNGLAVYGGLCLISGVTIQQIEKACTKILDHKNRPIEVAWWEVSG